MSMMVQFNHTNTDYCNSDGTIIINFFPKICDKNFFRKVELDSIIFFLFSLVK